MYKNKYLGGLGIDPMDYGLNYIIKTSSFLDNRSYKKITKKDGIDPRLTWNLETIIIEFLYSSLQSFLEYAGDIIDMEVIKIEIADESMNLVEAIDKICDTFARFLLFDDNDDRFWIDEETLDKERFIKEHQHMNLSLRYAMMLLGACMPHLGW